MTTSNPYAPPQHDDFSALPAGAGRGLQLSGDTLICDKGLSLPGLCLFNGEPSHDRVSRTLSWAPQWVIVLVAMSPLLGGIIYLIVRKSGAIEYSLGPVARKRKRDGVWLIFGGLFGGAIIATVAGVNDLPALLLVAILAGLVAIVVGSIRLRHYNVSRIDKQQIHLKLRPEAARAFERHLLGHR
jgi:hypothetical protein